MKNLITILVLILGVTVYAQNTNVTKETKTTTVTVDDGTGEPKKLVKTQHTEARQNVEVKQTGRNTLNKDIKETPVKVTETTTISGDGIATQELGETIRYELKGKTYILIRDNSGFKVYSPENEELGVIRKTSKTTYLYQTKDHKVSLGYFDNNGNFIIESYNNDDDSVKTERFSRITQ